MAFNSFQLFVNQVESNPPELQLQVMRIILDMLTIYEQDFLKRSPETVLLLITIVL